MDKIATIESLLRSNSSVTLKAFWQFNNPTDEIVQDLSGNLNSLKAIGNPRWISPEHFPGGVQLNGSSQWLETEKPVVNTKGGFSIVAWVRLDSSVMDNNLSLKTDQHALTAVSQNCPTHSVFYLGVREIEEMDDYGIASPSLRWCFTIAPEDGSETGLLPWHHVYSATPLNKNSLDKWVLLVGVCDVANRTTSIHILGNNEVHTSRVDDRWDFWQPREGLQVGRARWNELNVDHWPGSIGPVQMYEGVLTAEDVSNLYRGHSDKI